MKNYLSCFVCWEIYDPFAIAAVFRGSRNIQVHLLKHAVEVKLTCVYGADMQHGDTKG